jgi:hypothetical protein
MFNKNDPLIASVKKVMAENETRRQAEFDLNEELGIASKRALPHEHHANYDALLEHKIAEALKGNQHKIDANQNGRVDGQDFKILKAKKQVQEADDETHEISFADKPGQKFTAMGKDPTKLSDADAKAQMDKQNALPGSRDNKGFTTSNDKNQKPDDTASTKKASPDTPEGREGYSSDWKNAPKRPAPHSPEDDEDSANMLKAAETQYQRNREAIKSGRPNDVKTDLGTDANGNKKYFSPIYPTKPDGTSETKTFDVKYTVGTPGGAAVMPDKMNVFYIGVDNPVTIGSPTGWDKTTVSMTNGTITGNGSVRTVRVSALGKASITVNADKKPTTFEFRVKKIPDPIFKVGSGKVRMPSVEFKSQQFCRAELENFDFDLKFNVTSATVYFSGANFPNVATATLQGNNLAPLSSFMSRCGPGSVITFDNVKVQGPDGPRTIEGKSIALY